MRGASHYTFGYNAFGEFSGRCYYSAAYISEYLSMTPEQHYRADLKKEGFQYDPSQEMAVSHLQQFWEALVEVEQKSGNKSLLQRLGVVKAPVECVRGLYFWGGVGRGKTYLMDVFFDSLPFERKYRTHFHRFMQRVHRRLKALDGQKNPLDTIAAELAAEYRVICFDEFFVSDIADAMILGGLFQQMFSRGVSLLATSNIVPDDLYKDGLQRQRFLPAIAALKEHTRVLNVDGGVDYRLRTLQQAPLFYSPAGQSADVKLLEVMQNLVTSHADWREDVSLEVEGRKILARRVCEDVVWFDFKSLCDGPRSQNDYIELAREFHTVLLSDVPQLYREVDDQARRFINLVDEFYDRNVKLIISAAVGLTELYAGGKLDFEFQRTQSRLLEMQSTEFLARPHRP